MYSKNDLITDSLPPLMDNKLSNLKMIVQSEPIPRSDVYSTFINQAKHYFASSDRNKLPGLEQLVFVDATIGCTHFIDNLIQKYSLSGLQIFEHDYKYYQRLDPNIKFATVGNLVPCKPVLIAAPFPGYLDLHIQWEHILAECLEKDIDIHIDGCWMGAANDIKIDLGHPAIKSIGFSLSKSLGMHWNRIGLRFSKCNDTNDSITIQNKFGMIPECLMHNAVVAMDQVNIDYLWNTYEAKHMDICKQLYLRPSKIIYAAHSMDRKKLYGLKKLIEQG
jgi:hypothetical protein